MLVLELKANDPIRVGDCLIKLERFRPSGRVWLAFDCPREIPIVRLSAERKRREALAAQLSKEAEQEAGRDER